MDEIKTLHWCPREGMQVTEKPSVVTVKFGDGYQQRRPAGLNAQLKTFQVVFRVTTDAEREALSAFLSWHGGYRAFCGSPRNITGRSGWCAGSGVLRITPGTVISVAR